MNGVSWVNWMVVHGEMEREVERERWRDGETEKTETEKTETETEKTERLRD